MKRKSISCRDPRLSAGFTLVEILVVIAIIAILAAAFIVGASTAINSAKRSKAGVIANQIQTAILNYQTEYGVYPVVPIAANATATDTLLNTTGTGAAGEQNLMIALCGNINASNATATTSTVPNSRNIPYLTPRKSDVDANGVLVNPFSTGTNYYFFSIAMDSDYSGILGDNPASAQPPNFIGWGTNSAAPAPASLTQGVAVWACCDPSNLATPSASKSPNLWVHTY